MNTRLPPEKRKKIQDDIRKQEVPWPYGIQDSEPAEASGDTPGASRDTPGTSGDNPGASGITPAGTTYNLEARFEIKLVLLFFFITG